MKKDQVNVRLAPETKAKLIKLAKKNKATQADVITRLLNAPATILARVLHAV